MNTNCYQFQYIGKKLFNEFYNKTPNLNQLIKKELKIVFNYSESNHNILLANKSYDQYSQIRVSFPKFKIGIAWFETLFLF